VLYSPLSIHHSHTTLPDHYHYIITGAGLAGSSLLMRMMREPFFGDKKILVIDQSPKTQNDRTWCFWEKEPDIFESIIHHRWEKIEFFSNSYADTLNISPYQYKMIQGIDLYTFVKEESNKHPNIEWKYETIQSIKNIDRKAVVETSSNTFTADYIFNSILFNSSTVSSLGDGRGKGSVHLLLQHFKGWVIETNSPCFNPSKATFMDFRVSQERGTTFMYVMPTSPATALVEYTLFTKELLPQEAYEDALRQYISVDLGIADYKITHEEFGVIPMTNQLFSLQEERIIYMGIAGGQAKGSSGYAFRFIQKRTAQIVDDLMKAGSVSLHRTWNDKKFHLYDSVLLNVLCNHKMNGAEIFSRIFQHNPPQRVLRFLDNESTFTEDLQIMRSVPTGIFLPAAMQELMG
jgi:lycopene beta-cyclase